MKLYCIIALYSWLRPETAAAQQEELMTLSLQQAIEIAQENSPEAQAARHTTWPSARRSCARSKPPSRPTA